MRFRDGLGVVADLIAVTSFAIGVCVWAFVHSAHDLLTLTAVVGWASLGVLFVRHAVVLALAARRAPAATEDDPDEDDQRLALAYLWVIVNGVAVLVATLAVLPAIALAVALNSVKPLLLGGLLASVMPLAWVIGRITAAIND